MKKLKAENKILIMLAFFSISIGLWGNFRQLWLQNNNFDAVNIGNIISIGTFVSVIGILIIGRYIGLNKLKNTVTFTLIVKFLNVILLVLFNGTGLNNLVKFLIVIDIVTEYIVITSIYPLITTIVKNNTIYSKRKLTEYLFRDIGILFGGMFIGKSIFGQVINYNLCLVISSIFLLISILITFKLKVPEIKVKSECSRKIFEHLLKNKIVIVYLIYVFIGSVAMSTALGLKMLTLTNYYNFSDNLATNYFLVIGLVADVLGILALKFFTPKNDYVTMTIKFGVRFLGYMIAFLSNNMTVILIAMTWSLLISTAYENVCDGPYINSVDNRYQLQFTNIRYVVRFLGEAVGVFFCGLMYIKGLKYMFGLSAFFMIFQLTLCYTLIYMRTHIKKRVICKKNPKIKYKERKCAYAMICDGNGNVAITNDGKYFFFGGGTEENETPLETLNREMIEETGYKLKDVKLFDNIISYEYNSSRGYLKIDATIYTAKFDEKVCEPIETDHPILWGKPEEHIDNMYHEYQKVMLKEYSMRF